ncbi:MAG: ABC transporter ATP-binding protein [Gammaproteobacteria bacterium]|nr:ABC transporter ATP-binding protein [Gammaproteobacteria bacterium]
MQANPLLPAIAVDAISKVYRLWARPSSRLLVPLLQDLTHLPVIGRWCRGAIETQLSYHHALENVSFRLMPGESLGIIGLNGSGKSTLLQIVAGVLQPTSGAVAVHGRIAALLELGSGFNPEMTGRENVYVNAAILGLSRVEIEAELDNILAFADIGGYVDQPVKTYSSGMLVRLAFAVQVHVKPDILIVDEALAVGDAQFQAKAMAKIDEILAGGTTLLFVGHDLGSVKAFCNRAMLLEKGRVLVEGAPDDVIQAYLYRIHKENLEKQDTVRLERVDWGYGVEDACVVAASVNGGVRHLKLGFGERVELSFVVRVRASLARPQLIFDVLDGKGLQLTGRRIELPVMTESGTVKVQLSFKAEFQKGIYRVRTRVVDAPSLEQTTVYSRQEGWLSFDVIDDSREHFTGLFPVPMDCLVEPLG